MFYDIAVTLAVIAGALFFSQRVFTWVNNAERAQQRSLRSWIREGK